ncbi:hypothetical protein BGZ98_010432 [Dissophora globulifera]|nr:hypothetical protein BGZ98_010432 [Dissophora globulifera]
MLHPQRTPTRPSHRTFDPSPRSTPIPGSHAQRQLHNLSSHHRYPSHSYSDNDSVTTSRDNRDSASNSNTFRQSPDLTSVMTTDDDASSAASFRQRPRKLSKAGSMPSPLGPASSFSSAKNSSASALSAPFSFLNLSGAKSSSNYGGSVSHHNASTVGSTTDPTGKTPSQLRVRHLDHDSIYAGYLTKFSSRTFFSRKQWKRRYFILSEKSLHCFKSSDPQHPLLESLILSPEAIICVTDVFAGKRFCLQISCPGEKNWYVLADTATEMSGWLKELKNAVQRVRHVPQPGRSGRSGTQYSDSSEISDMSGTTSATATVTTTLRIPSVPAIPSLYDPSFDSLSPSTMASSTLAGVRQSYVPQQLYTLSPHRDLYRGISSSLNPPPRSFTPMPSTPMPGAVSSHQQQQPSSLYLQHLGQHQQLQLQQQQQQQQQQQEEEARRKLNSSLSAIPPDYTSFGSIMERAEAMALAQKEQVSSSWSAPTRVERSDIHYATVPRSKRDSIMSTASSVATTSTYTAQPPRPYRASIMVDGSETSASLSHRGSQRLGGMLPLSSSSYSSSRPLSPISSRPLSPSSARTSPRSSLVISPPPRSIHRPSSMAIRHSTQILPPLQMAAGGKPSLASSESSSTSNNNNNNNNNNNSSSSNNNNSSSNNNNSSSNNNNNNSSNNNNNNNNSSSNNNRFSFNPPTSRLPATPAPDASSATHRPLSRLSSVRDQRQPGTSDHSGPSTKRASTIGTSTLYNGSSNGGSNSISNSIGKSNSISKSNGISNGIGSGVNSNGNSNGNSASNGVMVHPRHPRELALSRGESNLKRNSTIGSSSLSNANSIIGNGTESNGNSGTGHNRQLSLPIHTKYVLPAPPTGQAPTEPPISASASASASSSAVNGSSGSTRPLMHRPAGSNAALRPISSLMNNVASLGGGVARRPSSEIKRDVFGAGPSRLSTVILPPEPKTAVPMPPKATKGSLPAPPTSALPQKPSGTTNIHDSDKQRTRRSINNSSNNASGRVGNGIAGFGSILEEEEDDDDDEDEQGEYVSRLQFEELEAARAAAEPGLDP